MIYSGHSFSFPRVAAINVPMISTTAMPTGPSAHGFGGFARRHILVILWKLRHSYVFRPTDKIYLRLSVGKTGVGIFPIRQALRLRNWRLQFLQGFLMVFYSILEFSVGALVLRVYDGSPRVRNFLHDSLNHLSVGIGIYERK